jgi:hypothetical protein
MKHASKLLLVLALAGFVASSFPASSHAQKAPIAPSQATSVSDPTQDRWWGVAGAMGCGFGYRLFVGTGGNPWVGGATVIMCLIMIADVVTS